MAFGRSPGNLTADLAHRFVRWEPLARLLPESDPLSTRDAIALSELRGLALCLHAGNQASPEWIDAGAQVAAAGGALSEPEDPPAYGVARSPTACAATARRPGA